MKNCEKSARFTGIFAKLSADVGLVLRIIESSD
jgi:hypothetical protein